MFILGANSLIFVKKEDKMLKIKTFWGLRKDSPYPLFFKQNTILAAISEILKE